MVQYYDTAQCKTIVELLDLVLCESGTAASLTNDVLTLLTSLKISLERYKQPFFVSNF